MATKPKAADPSIEKSNDPDPYAVVLPVADVCCISPCDPPWIPEKQCMVWYETRYLRVPFGTETKAAVAFVPERNYIEFRITYAHRMCLLGKQHGPLLYTVTLLPGEKVTLYHSDRYRQITSVDDRYSVQTTFMQFLSVVHQARVTDTLSSLSDKLSSISGSFSTGGGLDIGIASFGASASVAASTTDHNVVQLGHVSDQFNQSVTQSSQLTQAERSVVVSTYSEKDTTDISSRVIQNDNACRAVTYFVRKVVELYAFSTVVADISYRVIAPNVAPDWHQAGDLAWLPGAIQTQIKTQLKLLPKPGDVAEAPMPISLPTDGTVYDPELAHCCSCEPQREAAMDIQLEKQKAEAMKARLEAQLLDLEVQRRSLLLAQGQLGSFDPAATPAPAPPP